MVTITINGEERLYEDGIKYEIIAEEYQNHFTSPIALVTVNGKIRELMKRVDRDCELDFITYEDTIGHKAYVRSAIMLMMKAIKDMKIFVNTIKGTVKTIQDAGMPAEITESENDEYLEVVIRLPKKELNQQEGVS